MFNWNKPKCQHVFTNWQVIKRLGNDSGDYVIIQERQCKACGLTEIIRKST